MFGSFGARLLIPRTKGKQVVQLQFQMATFFLDNDELLVCFKCFEEAHVGHGSLNRNLLWPWMKKELGPGLGAVFVRSLASSCESDLDLGAGQMM